MMVSYGGGRSTACTVSRAKKEMAAPTGDTVIEFWGIYNYMPLYKPVN